MKADLQARSRRRISPNSRLSPYLEVILSPLRRRSHTLIHKAGEIGRKTPHFCETGQNQRIPEQNYQSEVLFQGKRQELVALKQAFSQLIEVKQQLLKSFSLKASTNLGKSDISGLATETEDLYSLLSSSHSTISQLLQRYSALAAELHRVAQETALQRYRSEEEIAALAVKASMVGLT